MLRSFLLLCATLIATPSLADEVYRFGEDAYIAGDNVTLSGDAVDDAFVAGNTVVISAPVNGTAHAGGRSVSISGPVGNNVYAAGMNVNISGPVDGDVQLFGDTVLVTAPIGKDLRLAAQRAEITASIGDDALIGAEHILLTGVIAGDASFSTKTISFGENAKIEGTLHLYVNSEDAVEVPAHVVPADRIVRHATEAFDPSVDPEGGATAEPNSGGWMAWLSGQFTSILILAALATLIAALAPAFLINLRERTLETPMRAVWMGFLSISALAGSLFLFALTGYGILLVPASIVLALLLGVAGYVIGTYILGVAVLSAMNRPLPETLTERAIAAAVGAVSVTVLAMIPVIGWIGVLAVAIAGAGALIIRWFAPGFHTEVR
ncbi:hypothetical protein SAMN04488030_2127 [Aliiroseovarius halocynthiae]|uniref:DUF8173 domain-containing protein n=1 Tax=Aliiroseovarius halocynthiae TaxID=985055 RepID=A0A545SRM5_9RHOB|nr:hypothetical protein [Aliiroseovarius halocynthiae]TQV67630.1 hypothetical protein FIL88_10485 [Aliiroseovarius halocynthiae]SMR81666.1 hypothetical protein SAMN04488030_2127 [Aliiroseovarius halocynthiae]